MEKFTQPANPDKEDGQEPQVTRRWFLGGAGAALTGAATLIPEEAEARIDGPADNFTVDSSLEGFSKDARYVAGRVNQHIKWMIQGQSSDDYTFGFKRGVGGGIVVTINRQGQGARELPEYTKLREGLGGPVPGEYDLDGLASHIIQNLN